MMQVEKRFGDRVRAWQGVEGDDGSIHAMGNTHCCAYGQGPDIIQFFGPPYSSPESCAQLRLKPVPGLSVQSRRQQGAAIWLHEIFLNGERIGECRDMIDAKLNVLVRRVRCEQALVWVLTPPAVDQVEFLVNPARFAQWQPSAAIQIRIPMGAPVFHYPTLGDQFYQFLATGPVQADPDMRTEGWTLRTAPGESLLMLCAGSEYPACMRTAEAALATPYVEIEARTEAWWQRFTDRRKRFDPCFSDGSPWSPQVMETVDDLAVMIRAQQGADGSVLAGHFYHLGYIRDQYGVARALLEMGYFDEARQMLERLGRIWQRLGYLNNAHGISDGPDDKGAVYAHVHENDEVEITGYLLVQAFDYVHSSGDESLLDVLRPALEWAFDVQVQHLHRGMLPFNGDETYVAGGVLPRSALNDGSAEATMLFVAGGELFVEWMAHKGYWNETRLAAARATLAETRASFEGNFWREGRLLTNNPERIDGLELPRFRHGVCEGKDSIHFGWTERNAQGRYLSPEQLARPLAEQPGPVREAYSLQSVSMVPLFIGSDLVSRERLAAMIEPILAQYKATGALPSRPDQSITVGLDYGLLLITLVELGHPEAALICEQMRSLIDPTGAWVEYYDNNKPKGCRCRPWEGGVNLVGMLRYLRSR